MIQACLNGGRGLDAAPAVPVTPGALAADASAAVAAGAACLHIHPRAEDGSETLAPGAVGAALEAVRETVPGVPVGVGTGAWIAPGGRARHTHIRGWQVRPDHASVNLSEADAPEVVALLAGLGVAVEAGIWSVADAGRFAAEIDPGHCLRVLVEVPDLPEAEARAEADAVLGALGAAGNALPVLLHGAGRSAWPCIARAAELGLDTRVGYEDTLELPDGTPAATNAELVAAAAGMFERA